MWECHCADLFDFSLTQFPHVENGSRNTCFTGLLCRSNEFRCMKVQLWPLRTARELHE